MHEPMDFVYKSHREQHKVRDDAAQMVETSSIPFRTKMVRCFGTYYACTPWGSWSEMASGTGLFSTMAAMISSCRCFCGGRGWGPLVWEMFLMC